MLDMNEEAEAGFRSGSLIGQSKSSYFETKESSQDNAIAWDMSIFFRNSAINCVLQIKTVMDSEIAG